jgi:hypothetical protein
MSEHTHVVDSMTKNSLSIAPSFYRRAFRLSSALVPAPLRQLASLY